MPRREGRGRILSLRARSGLPFYLPGTWVSRRRAPSTERARPEPPSALFILSPKTSRGPAGRSGSRNANAVTP